MINRSRYMSVLCPKKKSRKNKVESIRKGVNQRSKDVTQTQQQRPESPAVTLTWHAGKYKVHKLHQRYILKIVNTKLNQPETEQKLDTQ